MDPNPNDNDGKDYKTAKETGEEDSRLNLSENYNSDVMEVSSGKFEAVFPKKYKDPKDFKQELWNSAGLLPESIILHINIVKKELKDANYGLPFDPTLYGQLYNLLVEESRREYKEKKKFPPWWVLTTKTILYSKSKG